MASRTETFDQDDPWVQSLGGECHCRVIFPVTRETWAELVGWLGGEGWQRDGSVGVSATKQRVPGTGGDGAS